MRLFITFHIRHTAREGPEPAERSAQCLAVMSALSADELSARCVSACSVSARPSPSMSSCPDPCSSVPALMNPATQTQSISTHLFNSRPSASSLILSIAQHDVRTTATTQLDFVNLLLRIVDVLVLVIRQHELLRRFQRSQRFQRLECRQRLRHSEGAQRS